MKNETHDDRPRTPLIVITLLVSLFAALIFGREAFSRNGLRKDYFVPIVSSSLGTGRQSLSTRDANISLSSERSLLADLWRHWNPEQQPFPEAIPPYSVTWSGQLTVPPARTAREPGLTESIYRGTAVTGSPVRLTAGVSPHFDYARRTELGELGPIAIEWLGELSIPEDGQYTFFISSDDGSSLYLDGEQLIDNRGTHHELEKSGKKILTKGEHRVRIRYFDHGGRAAFDWAWSTPERGKSGIPIVLLHSAEGMFTVLQAGCNCEGELHAGTQVAHGQNLSIELEPGTVPFSLSVSRGHTALAFSLLWRAANGTYLPISPRAFTLPGGFSESEGTGWLAILLLASSAYLMYKNRKSPPAASWNFALSLLVFSLSFSLRWYQYDFIPYLFDTADELITTWMGINVIRSGHPTAWVFPGASLSASYKQWLGQPFLISIDVFHPPALYGTIVGAVCRLFGIKHMFNAQVSIFRLPSVFFSSITVLPLMLFARRRLNASSALLTGLIYATLPVCVLLGRLTKEDVFLGFLLAALLCVTERFLRSAEKRPPKRMLFLVFLGPLAKEAGICLALFAGIACIQARRYRALMYCGAAALLGEFLYVGWGLTLNAKEFVHMVRFHKNLVDRLVEIQKLFFDFRIWDFQANGWLLWMWIAAAAAAQPRHRLLWTALASYLLVFFFISVAPYDFPWYRIPILPLLCIFGGIFLNRLSSRAELSHFVTFLILAGTSSLQLALIAAPNGLLSPTVARLGVFLLVGIVVASSILPRRAACGLALAVISAFILSNVYLCTNLQQTYTGILGGSW